ncbi:hypothetical protein B0A49_05732 [Cryomyces minteri]|uniref:FAS1 domain-containing protein n=1 Tax=Cryomyces minteri TaxID=331657 RepID=A0A4U0X858_9PEZI|nr:hypothetical protein B0A49_05732 [Cryomyces minteri]
MQYKALTLLALSAAAIAAPEKRQAASSPDLISIISVLQTALPQSLVQMAFTNSAGVSSEIASQFAAGATPTWFTALPSDIQTYLVPLATNGAAFSSAVANATGVVGAPGVNATAIAGNTTAIGVAQSSILSSIAAANSSTVANATSAGVVNLSSTASITGSGSSSGSSSSAARTSTSSRTSASAAAGSSSTSSAGASLPTAVVGMGLAGVVGFVGMLAL